MGSNLTEEAEASLIKFVETTAQFKESLPFFTSLIKGDFQWFEETTKALDAQGHDYNCPYGTVFCTVQHALAGRLYRAT